MRIVVMRLGTAMTPQRHTNVGHGDEMVAMLLHLQKQHELLAIGRFGVDPPCRFEQQRYTSSFPNEEVEAFNAEYDRLVAVAKEFDPECIVTVIGPSGSTVLPGNGPRTQAFAANYCGPVVKVWNAFPHIKRVCILNDPRNIIRMREIEVYPDAVLSQTNADIPLRAGDKSFIRHYRYHKTQNWGLPTRAPVGQSKIGECVVLAHSHIEDARVGKNRQAVWDYIRSHLPSDTVFRGRGWPDGPIPANEVQQFLQDFEWGPMIPITEGWVTAKFGQYARANCVPRPYSPAGGFLNYDSQFLMIPENHPLRWMDLERDPGRGKEEWLDWANEITQPDFSSLDNVLTDLDKLPLYDVYGGYERVA